MLFVEEKRDGEIANLLFGVLCPGHKIDSFKVTKIDVPSENVDVEQLRNISAAQVWL